MIFSFFVSEYDSHGIVFCAVWYYIDEIIIMLPLQWGDDAIYQGDIYC